MKQINDKLDGLSELITRVDAKILDINTKLDELIKALHEYDDDGYGESSFEAFMDDEEAANKRMDIIGQNGNEGSHYVTNEEADEDAAKFDDYGKRIVWVNENKNNDTQNNKHTGEKKRNKRKYYKPKQTK
jgi:hypothetical protein